MKVVIIGGGISGLATAHAIRERATEQGVSLELMLLEAGSRLGGTIETHEQDGFRCEAGPNGFLDSKPHTLALAEKLGLSEQLIGSDDSAARRFVMVNGSLIELPKSPGQFMMSRLLPFGSRLRVIWERFIGRGGKKGETVAEFATRRLGVNAYERLIDPFVSGIFAGDPTQLEVAAAFPRLVELESAHGSLIKASIALKKENRAENSNGAGPSGRLTSFKEGLSVLIDTLGESLGSVIALNSAVVGLKKSQGQWTVECAGGRTITEVDVVVLAIPAHVAAKVLGSIDTQLVEALANIPYVPVTVVAMGFERSQIQHDLDGFGFLVPTREARQVLGCLWSSSIFPGCRAPEGHVLLRTIVGGAKQPEIALLPDDELVDLIVDELKPVLQLQSAPSYVHLVRYERGIPQYVKGHIARVEQLDAALEAQSGLFVTGNALRGVGINDCTREAMATAEAVIPG